MMAELIVIGYDNAEKAEAARSELHGLAKEYLVEVGDAVVATRDAGGVSDRQRPGSLAPPALISPRTTATPTCGRRHDTSNVTFGPLLPNSCALIAAFVGERTGQLCKYLIYIVICRPTEGSPVANLWPCPLVEKALH